jgi:hypothetical protein
MAEITLQSLLTVTGLALFLSAIVIPLLKRLTGSVTEGGTLLVLYAVGILVSVVASLILVHPITALSVGNSVITGIVAAAMANAMHQAKEGIVGNLKKPTS